MEEVELEEREEFADQSEDDIEEEDGSSANPVDLSASGQSSVRPVAVAIAPSSKKSEFDQSHTPAGLWHLLIEEIEKHHQPILKDFMMEGTPHSIEDSVLTVFYDNEFDQEHAMTVMRNMEMLKRCLHRITGNRSASIEIRIVDGIASLSQPASSPSSGEELEAVRQKVKANTFVQQTLDLFGGDIVDVHG
jgi:hypothetical protein